MSDKLVKTKFLDKLNIIETFRQLYSNSEIPFFQFKKAVEFNDKDKDGNNIITYLGGFQMKEDWNIYGDEKFINLYAVYMSEDEESIKDFEKKKIELEEKIKKLDKNDIENLKKLNEEKRVLYRLTEYDSDAEEVLKRPSMELNFHSEKLVVLSLDKLLKIETGTYNNPTFFELEVVKMLITIRVAQRLRSLDGLYLLKIHKNSNFI